ncbi:DUF971 domain-containing protein [bacterium]|nr:DUF971 domain-containing protein [bacterium]
MARNRKRLTPKEIFFDGKMNIIWQDNTHSIYDYWELRTSCPCADCVDEITGEKTLDDSTIDKDIHPVQSAYIGNYALEILWSDNHDTGIYTFENLRDRYPHEEKPVS